MHLRSLVPVIALGVVASLGSAAQGPDPIVGQWSGNAVFLTRLNDEGDIVVAAETSTEAAEYSDDHVGAWGGFENGRWSKSRARYRLNLSKTLTSAVEASSPDAKIKQANFTLSNIELTGSAQFGAVHINLSLTENGAKVKQLVKGSFAFNKDEPPAL